MSSGMAKSRESIRHSRSLYYASEKVMRLLQPDGGELTQLQAPKMVSQKGNFLQ